MAEGQRDVIMITADSVRYDAVDGEEARTPNLDRLRQTGIGFQQATSPGPKMPESMPAIWTGHHPSPVDEDQSDYSDWQSYWQSKIQHTVTAHDTIAESFQRAGYDTGAITTNTWTTEPFGFDKGFDNFHDAIDDQFVGEIDLDRYLQRIPYGNDLYRLLFRQKSLRSWDTYYDDFLDLLTNLSSPSFGWIFLMDTHFPYLPPRRHRSLSMWRMYATIYQFRRSNWGKEGVTEETLRNLTTLYHDTVEHVDEFVGRLLDESPNDPIIVFYGDHAEAFGEHGYYYHRYHLFEENIHVPLIIGNVDGADSIEPPISLRQLPKICQLLRDNPDDLSDRLRSLAGSSWSRSDEGDSIAIWSDTDRTVLEQSSDVNSKVHHPNKAHRVLSHLEELERIREATDHF